jgi:hypothetical protein
MPKKIFGKIGHGSIGGKALGLTKIQKSLDSEFDHESFPEIHVLIPKMNVVATDVFDSFMERNKLHDIARSNLPDDRIALAFQQAELPFEVLGELRYLVAEIQTPLAIRSSSLLEDSTGQPFAGVYRTKMIPNNQDQTNARFRKLEEAIKFVWASTYFRSAREYIKVTDHHYTDEKMAVLIQEEFGKKHRLRFYPELSGVARSINYYPFGKASQEDGVVHLALGLGKTIVDGGISWIYSPKYPEVSPPYGSVEDLLKRTQTKFWVVNMGEPPRYDPINETEYLLHKNITAAEIDSTLSYLVSTYDAYSRRLSIGTGYKGARVLNFAPLLKTEQFRFNQLINTIMSFCEDVMQGPVEIEFAMSFDPHRFALLQVRRMIGYDEKIDVAEADFVENNVLLSSDSVMGNGKLNYITDIVFVRPEKFETRYTKNAGEQIAAKNAKLVDQGKQYILIVFGRLGTADPWLGIPLKWEQISGAKVVVETTKDEFNVVMSQGSHYFHNLNSMRVSYFSVPNSKKNTIDWDWLYQQEVVEEDEYICHIRMSAPVLVKVDGRNGRGVILKSRGQNE